MNTIVAGTSRYHSFIGKIGTISSQKVVYSTILEDNLCGGWHIHHMSRSVYQETIYAMSDTQVITSFLWPYNLVSWSAWSWRARLVKGRSQPHLERDIYGQDTGGVYRMYMSLIIQPWCKAHRHNIWKFCCFDVHSAFGRAQEMIHSNRKMHWSFDE